MKAVRYHEFGGPEVLRWEDAPDPEVRPHDPKNLQIIGLHIGMPPWTPEQHRGGLAECLALVSAGKVKPVISATFKMAEVAKAHEYLAARKTMGKVVLVP